MQILTSNVVTYSATVNYVPQPQSCRCTQDVEVKDCQHIRQKRRALSFGRLSTWGTWKLPWFYTNPRQFWCMVTGHSRPESPQSVWILKDFSPFERRFTQKSSGPI